MENLKVLKKIKTNWSMTWQHENLISNPPYIDTVYC